MTKNLHRILAKRWAIASIWDYSDVQMVRPDLTKQQAWTVLQAVEDDHNAEIGINWDVLEFHAETLFGPEPEDASDGGSEP